LLTINRGDRNSLLSSFDLTPAAPADAVAIARIVNGAYRGEGTAAGWTSEVGILSGARADVGTISRMTEAGHVFVLRDEAGAPTCCICLEAMEDATCYLSMIAVDPVHQGGGWGKKIIASAERYVRVQGGRIGRMTVIVARESLIAWYLRQGYEPTGKTEPFPYDDVSVGKPLRDDLHFIVLEKQL